MVCSTKPTPCKCTYNGNTLDIGATVQNGCNTCVCQSSGTVSCTNNPCNCQYMGKTMQFGETVLRDCNTCTCKQSGQVCVSLDKSKLTTILDRILDQYFTVGKASLTNWVNRIHKILDFYMIPWLSIFINDSWVGRRPPLSTWFLGKAKHWNADFLSQIWA